MQKTIDRKTALFIVLLLSIGYILVTLLAFNSPTHLLFNKDGDLENWASLIIGSGIAVYIALSTFIYSYYDQKLRNEANEKRKKFVMKMIGQILNGQVALLADLQRGKGKNIAVNMITGEKMNMDTFDEKGLQLNNAELKGILNISYDIIDTDLMDQLMNISSKMDFIEKFKEDMPQRGEWLILELIKNTIEKYFPDLLKDFNSHISFRRVQPV